jgi:hypothetical protein
MHGFLLDAATVTKITYYSYVLDGRRNRLLISFVRWHQAGFGTEHLKHGIVATRAEAKVSLSAHVTK